MAKNILSHELLEPLNGVTTAKIDINAGYANLIIGRLTGGEESLAGGELEYFEGQDPPTRTIESREGHAILSLLARDSGRPKSFLPWKACTAAYEWQINLNPAVTTDITAHSDGGNVQIDLAGCAVTSVVADTGGGNMELVLPEHAASLSVTAKSGAGNVVVRIPAGIAVKIHAASGLGKVIVDPKFTKIDAKTYQSPAYEGTAEKVEMTLNSGAGNILVSTV